mmetsp:Transcript_26851/g.75023  ORF Transcript_26851/g.75023 Transcript_26851/m.75023 type:complete len:204 (-) Transcript_26851:37-648(-)
MPCRIYPAWAVSSSDSSVVTRRLVQAPGESLVGNDARNDPEGSRAYLLPPVAPPSSSPSPPPPPPPPWMVLRILQFPSPQWGSQRHRRSCLPSVSSRHALGGPVLALADADSDARHTADVPCGVFFLFFFPDLSAAYSWQTIFSLPPASCFCFSPLSPLHPSASKQSRVTVALGTFRRCLAIKRSIRRPCRQCSHGAVSWGHR